MNINLFNIRNKNYKIHRVSYWTILEKQYIFHLQHEGKPYCHQPCYSALFGPGGKIIKNSRLLPYYVIFVQNIKLPLHYALQLNHRSLPVYKSFNTNKNQLGKKEHNENLANPLWFITNHVFDGYCKFHCRLWPRRSRES